jgi:putative DNA primase/helicase
MFEKDKKNWVLWKLEKDSKGKPTKVPYQTNGYHADSTKSSTWDTFDNVQAVASNFSGVGFVFNGATLGVDLDHVLKGKQIMDAASEKFYKEAKTYTEISPSGDGLHAIFKLSEPIKLSSNKYKPNEKYTYECYSEKRFFTFTENIFEAHDTLRTIDGLEALRLLALLGYPWREKVVAASLKQQSSATEEEILKKMFAARVKGAKIKALYNGDVSAYKDDESSADLALCSFIAFYAQNDYSKIESIWLASPLGKREKTQKRADYRKMTIERAMESARVLHSPDPSFDKTKKYVTKKNKDGVEIIVLNTQNIQIFLDTFPELAGRFKYDLFKQKTLYRNILNEWNALTDTDVIAIQCRISELHPAFWGVTQSMAYDAITLNARIHSFDSVKEYFTSLHWDGTPRIDTWLSMVYGAEENEYHKAVGSNWLKGLVMRAMTPASKFDCVLVLEGDQGIKKSMSLEALGGEWYVSTFLTPDNKDFFMTFIGNLIVEFAEGETLSRSDMKKLKSAITALNDDFRRPYGREVERFPRRCVFAMSTNESEYLKDDTGNRRWLPVATTKKEVDVDWVKQNRDQIFAEAYHRVLVLNEKYWEYPRELMEEEQKKRQFLNPDLQEIQTWYIGLDSEHRERGITVYEVYNMLYPESNTAIARKRMTKLDSIQIGSVLRGDLHLKKIDTKVNNIRCRVYLPTEKTPQGSPTYGEAVPSEFTF